MLYKEVTKLGKSNKEDIRPYTEDRENLIIAKANAYAEKLIDEGKAPAQIITHYLKLGTAKAKLELEILEEQKKLTAAKTENLQKAEQLEDIMNKAIKAMTEYAGVKNDEDL